jgi:hypothetical protein
VLLAVALTFAAGPIGGAAAVKGCNATFGLPATMVTTIGAPRGVNSTLKGANSVEVSWLAPTEENRGVRVCRRVRGVSNGLCPAGAVASGVKAEGGDKGGRAAFGRRWWRGGLGAPVRVLSVPHTAPCVHRCLLCVCACAQLGTMGGRGGWVGSLFLHRPG